MYNGLKFRNLAGEVRAGPLLIEGGSLGFGFSMGKKMWVPCE